MFLFVMLSILPLAAISAFAEETVYHDSRPDEMITEAFDTDIQAASDNSFHVQETITMDFIEDRHGIYRYIPLSDDYTIDNVDVDSGQYFEQDKEAGNLLIRIGDEDETVTGRETYEISYDIKYSKDSDEEKDFLSLDLLPTGWDTSIRESSMHLSMPSDVNWENMKLYCGQYGSSDFPADKVSVSTDEKNLYLKASDLAEGEGVTVAAELPNDYWKDAKYVNVMSTDSFDVDVQAASDHSFHVTETFSVEFLIPEDTTIERQIPLADNYKIENVQVESGQPYTVEDFSEDKRVVIEHSGSADNQKETCRISYDLTNYKDTNPAKDFLSLMIFPDGWDSHISEASMHLSMPYKVDWKNLEFAYGWIGFTESDVYPEGKLKVTADGKDLSLTTSDLSSPESITVRLDLPEGYWKDAVRYSELNRSQSRIGLIMMVAAILLSALCWILFGRDKHRMYRPVTLRAPRGLTPLEIGHYFHNGATDQDVVSMLFYYANKGYLRIHQTGLGKSGFELEKVKDADETENPVSRNLLRNIFALIGERPISLEGFKQRIEDQGAANLVARAKADVRSGNKIKDKGKNLVIRVILSILVVAAMIVTTLVARPNGAPAFLAAFVWAAAAVLLMWSVDRNKKAVMIAGLVLAAVAEVIMGVMMYSAGGIFMILMLLMIPVCTFFLAVMKSPSEEYAKLMGEIYAFRDFIQKVDEKRLREQLAESPDYFYDVLPYAVVFGLESRWSQQFTDLDIDPSDPWWYRSQGAFVYSSVWASDLVSSVGDSLKVGRDGGSRSTGRGGFSGGSGFTGSGGGGGGGGAW